LKEIEVRGALKTQKTFKSSKHIYGPTGTANVGLSSGVGLRERLILFVIGLALNLKELEQKECLKTFSIFFFF